MSSRTIDTGTEHLQARVEDRVAILTMNRPERRNALSGEMLDGLALALAEAESARDVGCVILTVAGGGFCAGGDVKGMAARGGEGGGKGPGLDERIHAQRLSQRATAGRIYRMPKPVIASLPGAAAGAGLSLALACDLRIASEKARLGSPEVALGLIPGWGATQRLPRLIPSCKAAEMLLMGKPIDAQEAYRIGLVNMVVPPEAVMSTAREWAETICQAGPLAVRATKEAMIRGSSLTLEDGLRLENALEAYVMSTEDFAEGTTAFVEKRKPDFKAR